MLGAGDDLVLEGLAEVAEVVAVAGDADDQVTVLFGMGLRLAQRLRIDDIELDMMAVELEVGADELNEHIEAGIVFQQLGRELLVEQSAAGAGVIQLGGGLEDRGGAVAVGALHGRDAFGERRAARRPSGVAPQTEPK